MFKFIPVIGIFSGYVQSSFLELPSPSGCEMKLLCAVVKAKSVGGESSHLWDSELLGEVRPYYEEGRSSTDTFKTGVYHEVTTGDSKLSNKTCWLL